MEQGKGGGIRPSGIQGREIIRGRDGVGDAGGSSLSGIRGSVETGGRRIGSGDGGITFVLTLKSVMDKRHQFVLAKLNVLQVRDTRRSKTGEWDKAYQMPVRGMGQGLSDHHVVMCKVRVVGAGRKGRKWWLGLGGLEVRN